MKKILAISFYLASILAACESTALSNGSVTESTVAIPSMSPQVAQPTTLIAVPTFTPMDQLTPPSACIMTQDQLPEAFPLDMNVEDACLRWMNALGSASDLELILNHVCGSPWGFAVEPLKAQVLEEDFTGDGRKDVLVAITFSKGGGAGEARVLGYISGEAGFISVMLFDSSVTGLASDGLFSGGGAEIMDIRYLNANRTPEIIFTIHWEDYAALFVKEWQDQMFVDRIEKRSDIQPGLQNAAPITNVEVDIEDYDNDGWAELLFTSNIHGPQPITAPIQRTEFWRRDGEEITFYDARYRPEPVYRYEAVLLGDYAFMNGDFDRALAFYQQAVFDEELLSWMEGHDPLESATADRLDERMRLNGYGRYRILLVHAVEGRASAARVVYENLIARIPLGSSGGIYVQLAKAFWEEFSDHGNYNRACYWTHNAMRSHESNPLAFLGKDFYGNFGYEYSLEDLCPYPLQE